MRSDFRASMDWVHTWSGIILGAIMLAIFFMGTLSVFKDEIDQWMWPHARSAAPVQEISLDRLYDVSREVSGEAPEWIRLLAPSERQPVPQFMIRDANDRFNRYFVDPQTYEIRGAFDSASASYFLYPMHYHLHLPAGRWIAGAVSMFLLLALFSGVVIHRKIIVDFFTFRRGKKLPRLSLDLHNLTSVLALPFHIAITLSGVVIFSTTYLAPTLHAVFPDEDNPRAHVIAETLNIYRAEPTGQTMLRMSSLDAMRIRAERYWGEQPFTAAALFHPDDAAGYVRMQRIGATEVAAKSEGVYFEASTGRLLQAPGMTTAREVQSFIVGLHEIHFDHWLLRWLYFFGGAAGCVMIATGFIYWLSSRRLQHARNGGWGLPVVEALTIWAVMGLLAATAAFFVANRALPPGQWTSLGIERLYWEVIVFYAVWLAVIPHGALRGKKAWFDQAALLAVLCILAPILNWVTTGDHLLRTILTGQWALAGMDMMLFGAAALSVYGALRLRRSWQVEITTGLKPAGLQRQAAAKQPNSPLAATLTGMARLPGE